MGRYPRQARDARVKCIDCNAPVIETVESRYACVNCGSRPITSRTTERAAAVEVGEQPSETNRSVSNTD